MSDALFDRASQAITLAQQAGAAEVWSSATRTREVDFTLRDGALETVQESTSHGLSLRLWVDGRYFACQTNDLRPDQLKAFIGESVALTRALEPDPERLITDPSLFAGRADTDLELFDPQVRDLDRDSRLALCSRQNDLLTARDGVLSATSSTSDGHTRAATVSSNGFSGAQESTWLWLGSELSMQDGAKKPEAWMWGGARQLDDVPSPEEVSRIALARIQARLGTTKGPTAQLTLVVDPSAAGRLISHLLRSANARSLHQGRSFWRDRQGEQVVSKVLTLVDDPLRLRGLGSRLYDDEGITARAMPIIDQGVLSNLYIDTYYGRKLGLDPTTGSASNRVVTPGSRDLDTLISATTDGIYLTSWLGGNADGTTGDFSFGLRGHRIEAGKIGQPISEMNVTGNLPELFSRLVEVGRDPWPYSRTLSPTLVFENVQFSGV